MYKKVELKNKERYLKHTRISEEKLDSAINLCLERLKRNAEFIGDNLVVGDKDKKNCYKPSKTVNWTNGAWTGMYLTAYNYTKDEFFKNQAMSQMPLFIDVVNYEEKLDDHDTGFKLIPSCVAASDFFGDKECEKAAIKGAEILYDHYCKENKFIIRIGKGDTDPDHYDWYRALVDSMMNIPLFFWAYEKTGDKKFYDAAFDHYHTTAKYLIREDGSSYHHYQFDPVTKKAVGGVTLQGAGDESCWTRGHAWLVYGYPVAYKYTKDKEIFDIHEAVTSFALDNLPSDNLCYWDFDFKDGSDEDKDSSANAIIACGLLEMCKYLDDNDEKKEMYLNAANMLVEALIDTCALSDSDTHGLITYVTGSKPHNMVMKSCATYGDFYYLEALIKLKDKNFKTIW